MPNTIMMHHIFGDLVLFWELLCQCDIFLHLKTQVYRQYKCSQKRWRFTEDISYLHICIVILLTVSNFISSLDILYTEHNVQLREMFELQDSGTIKDTFLTAACTCSLPYQDHFTSEDTSVT